MQKPVERKWFHLEEEHYSWLLGTGLCPQAAAAASLIDQDLKASCFLHNQMLRWNFILSAFRVLLFFSNQWCVGMWAKHVGLFTDGGSVISSVISITWCCAPQTLPRALAGNWFMKSCLFDFYHACSIAVNTLTLHKLITSQGDGFLSEGVMFLHSTVMGELENVRLSCAHAHAKITGPSANVHTMCTRALPNLPRTDWGVAWDRITNMESLQDRWVCRTGLSSFSHFTTVDFYKSVSFRFQPWQRIHVCWSHLYYLTGSWTQ